MGIGGGDLIFAGAGIAIALPFAHHLTRKDAPLLNPWIWKCWCFGLLLMDVYFANYPKAGHEKHKHVITNIVHVPLSLRIMLPIVAVLPWACLLKDRWVSGEFPKAGGIADKLKVGLRWILGPATLAIHLFIFAKIIHKFIIYPANYAIFLGIVGLIGSLVYAVGCAVLLSQHREAIDPIFSFVQMLGYFMCVSALLLVYTVVDWTGMMMMAMLVVCNFTVSIIGIVPDRYKGPQSVEYELVDNPQHQGDV